MKACWKLVMLVKTNTFGKLLSEITVGNYYWKLLEGTTAKFTFQTSDAVVRRCSS